MVEVNNYEGYEGKKYKLMHCNNPSSVGFNYIGLTNYLEIISLEGKEEKEGIEDTDTKSLFFFGSLRSSLIKDIKEEITKQTVKVIIQTLNTKYIFEEVLGDIEGKGE